MEDDRYHDIMLQSQLSHNLYSNDAHKRAEELYRLRIHADGEMAGQSPLSVQKPGRAPKGFNLHFEECLMLNDNFGPYSNADTAFLADLEDPKHKIFDGVKDKRDPSIPRG